VQQECRETALDVRVEVEFYPNSSWVKPGRKSTELLKHEQGHFDLTELYARKAEKQYDADTKDGTDGEREKEASEKIARELSELSRYMG
jgi:hypothetical protein